MDPFSPGIANSERDVVVRKLPDVCYSWWVLAWLKIMGRIHWMDKAKLRMFILACEDEETGGFADRPGDMVDPVLCTPEDALQRVNLQPDLLS